MYNSHPQLEEVDDSVVLWKYMNFTKFVALLVNEGVWFSRLDRFEDVFEGTYPPANERLRPEVYGDVVMPQANYDLIEHLSRLMYVSCFHANNYESAAMWSLYSKDEGVAIQTTVKCLKESLLSETRNIYLSPVTYIDFEKDFLPEGNLLYLAAYKRKSFEHEKEVRCIFSDDFTKPIENGNTGFNSKMDLNKLIQKVYVSPYAQPFIEHITIELLQKYSYPMEVVSSKLYTLT